MSIQLEDITIERLAGLCKLWGSIKYFHPALAYRADIDWDAALAGAIPGVITAANGREYATAIQGMLNELGDPVTRVIYPQPAEKTSPGVRHPIFEFTPGNTLRISIHHYMDSQDIDGTIQKLVEIKEVIPKAKDIIFDLRAKPPYSEDGGNFSYAFSASEISASLSSKPGASAGERSRMYEGFPQQSGARSGGYRPAFRLFDGIRQTSAPDARDLPIIILANSRSQIPPELLALQIAGKAALLFEGAASDASLVKIQRFPLEEGIFVEFRLSEVICEDGTNGFAPDLILPNPEYLTGEDPALAVSFELLKDFKLPERKRVRLPVYALTAPDKSYPEMEYPPLEYRLLAVFRIWNVIDYFFPYKDLMNEDWGAVLRKFIVKMAAADSALEYHLAVAEMVTHIHDSHGFVDSPIIKQHFGSAWPPIRLQMIENAPVITNILDLEVVKLAGAEIGDIVLEIDGENALTRIGERAKYRSASTPHRLMHRAAFVSLAGVEDSVAVLTLMNRNKEVKKVLLTRNAAFGDLSLGERSGDVCKFLAQDIGYADLDRLTIPEVDDMFEMFKDTKAIIFDMRGYPKATAWEIAPRLSEKKAVGAAWFDCPLVLAPDGQVGDITDLPSYHSFVQHIPATDKRQYAGKTVMLIDERCQSQAEHTGLFFEAANGTKFIGTHSAGANGDVTNFYLPGGITIWFTGMSVRHADGRQLQRIGLVPDIEVRPTINGIQNGKDEILESAIAYLLDELG